MPALNQLIWSFFRDLTQHLRSLYKRSQETAKDDEHSDLKVKKKMMLFVTFNMICLLLCLPILSPRVKTIDIVMPILMNVLLILLIFTKKAYLFTGFHTLTMIFMLNVFSLEREDGLRAIGMILMQHNFTFVFPDNKLLKSISILTTLVMTQNIQKNLSESVQQEDTEVMKRAIANIQYEWPLIYLLNQFCAIRLVDEYYKTFQESKEAHSHLIVINKELRVTNKKLETTLSLLEKTNKELNEAIKSRELFIASVSHELRNPLNALLGNIELLIMDIKDSQHSAMLQTCKKCSEMLLGLINNVLDVAKINAERVELNYQSINLHTLVDKVWNVSTINIRQKKLRGFLYLSKILPKYIKTDSHRLNQILLNLTGNATKFTNSGCIKLMITWHQDKTLEAADLKLPSQHFTRLTKEFRNEPRTPRSWNLSSLKNHADYQNDDLSVGDDNGFSVDTSIIRRVLRVNTMSNVELQNCVTFTENDGKIESSINNLNSLRNQTGILRIEIIDTGCGISQSAIQGLFKPFSQADPSVTRKYGGTGLGLYITKQLVEKMGGQVHMYSQETTGTSFCLLLPVETSIPVHVIPSDQGDTSTIICKEVSSRGRKALVVDDDPLNQMIMTNYLKRLSICADIASNGEEALSKFKSKNEGYYTLITMDIQMPIMDGLTACREIRHYETQGRCRRRIPIVVVTGNCTDIGMNKGLDPNGSIQASYFFRKPVTFEECASCVQMILKDIE